MDGCGGGPVVVVVDRWWTEMRLYTSGWIAQQRNQSPGWCGLRRVSPRKDGRRRRRLRDWALASSCAFPANGFKLTELTVSSLSPKLREDILGAYIDVSCRSHRGALPDHRKARRRWDGCRLSRAGRNARA